MSKLEELIAELCPNGVEYKELHFLADIGTGNSDRKDSAEYGIYPFYVRSKDILRINKYEYDEEAIVIPGEGGIGEIFHFVQGKYALHQRAYRIHITDPALLTRFLYHYMSAHFKKFILQKAVSATVTSIRKPMIEQFQIPVPPLEVQREIVRILDNFTFLSAELSAELSARKKQYEYYRNNLLLFKNNVEVKNLADVLKIRNGKDYKQYDEGKYPVYGTGGIMKYIDHYAYDKPSVLIPRKGSLDKLYYVDIPFWTVDTIFYTEIDDNKVLPKYVFYYLQMMHLEDLNKAGGVPSLTQTTLNKVKIYVPSLEDQKKIVCVLDKFDAICSNLKNGLPAEIEARQKQYEYYRDKLLTFKEKN